MDGTATLRGFSIILEDVVILSHKHYLSNPDVALAKIRYDPTSPGRILCLLLKYRLL